MRIERSRRVCIGKFVETNGKIVKTNSSIPFFFHLIQHSIQHRPTVGTLVESYKTNRSNLSRPPAKFSNVEQMLSDIFHHQWVVEQNVVTVNVSTGVVGKQTFELRQPREREQPVFFLPLSDDQPSFPIVTNCRRRRQTREYTVGNLLPLYTCKISFHIANFTQGAFINGHK